MYLPVLLLLTTACDKPPIDSGSPPETLEVHNWTREGPAPWDGLFVG